MTPQAERLKTYLVSDVHLNNHPWDQEAETENPRRRNFREFLTTVNNMLLDSDEIRLVLNGDILDITGSWFSNDRMPWDNERAVVEQILLDVLAEILDNNRQSLEEWQRLLSHPGAEIIYVFGNHDGLLELFPSSQAYIRERVFQRLPAELRRPERFRFVTSYECERLGLYVEHGHRLDPYNVYDSKQKPPMGDVVSVLIVNRFVDMVVSRLEEQGYSAELIGDLKHRLHDIEYLRPLALFPLWIETVASQYQGNPESRGKREPIETIIRHVIADILLDDKIIGFLNERFHLPRRFFRWLVRLLVRFPAVLPLLSFIVSKLIRRTHSNRFQYRNAQRMHRDKGHSLIVFGHTHIPSVKALSHEGYYFNTGSWTPVINLFKYSDVNPAHIEYLTADERFKKVERCGILRIEKDLIKPDASPRFSLQTIQSGGS